MGRLNSHEQLGFVFQNFILNILNDHMKGSAGTINFWRTISGSEVDFVINRGKDIIPVEAKYSDIRKPEIEKSLMSFIGRYKPKKALIINLSLRAEKKIGETTVKFLPYYDIGKEL
jgi:hypothetical protein